jgi:hypothetical protein
METSEGDDSSDVDGVVSVVEYEYILINIILVDL